MLNPSQTGMRALKINEVPFLLEEQFIQGGLGLNLIRIIRSETEPEMVSKYLSIRKFLGQA